MSTLTSQEQQKEEEPIIRHLLFYYVFIGIWKVTFEEYEKPSDLFRLKWYSEGNPFMKYKKGTILNIFSVWFSPFICLFWSTAMLFLTKKFFTEKFCFDSLRDVTNYPTLKELKLRELKRL